MSDDEKTETDTPVAEAEAPEEPTEASEPKEVIAYIAHPVGSHPLKREENLYQAKLWFEWLLVEYPEWAISMPWLIYCQQLRETPENRARGIRDDLRMLKTHNTIVLVGGELSPGMSAELEMAKTHGLEVVDLLELGARPPPRA